MEFCFAEDNYTVNETEGNVVINLRVTGKYFVLMNATISCTEGTATSEKFILYTCCYTLHVRYVLTFYFKLNSVLHAVPF